MWKDKRESAILFLTGVVMAGKFESCALLPCALPSAIALKRVVPWKGGVGRR